MSGPCVAECKYCGRRAVGRSLRRGAKSEKAAGAETRGSLKIKGARREVTKREGMEEDVWGVGKRNKMKKNRA